MKSNRTPFEFLSQMASVLTFLGLELICLFLIINKNSNQRDIAMETASVWSTAVGGKFSGWVNYFGLNSRMDSMQQHNAAMKTALLNANLAEVVGRDTLILDTIAEDHRQRYQMLPVRITNKSPYSKRGNTFVINQGSKQGVSRGQGVISDRGPLGIVTHVTQNYARVMTLLDLNSKVSACLVNNVHGSLMWDGTDPRYSFLHYIPDYEQHPGNRDTVYTTSYSNVYPSAIPIGKVVEYIPQSGSGSWKIKIALFEDLLAVTNAYVVIDLEKEELEALNAEE